MDCMEAREYVSALHDGERIPTAASEHIASCPACRGRLREYAEIGSEMRLLATVERGDSQAKVMPTELPLLRRPWWHAWARSVRVPRLALGVLGVLLLAAAADLVYIHAQGGETWFRYQIRPSGRLAGRMTGAISRPASSNLFTFSDNNETLAINIEVREIRDAAVQLVVRAKSFAGKPDRSTIVCWLISAPAQKFTYIPGQTLAIPAEGGGALTLTGTLVDRARNSSEDLERYPLHPKPEEIVANSPVLARGHQILLDLRDSAAEAENKSGNPAIVLYAPPEGLFAFALKPFEGAVPCEAILGQARCTLEAEQYTLFSATPITGGYQPRKSPNGFRAAAPSGHRIRARGASFNRLQQEGAPGRPLRCG